MSIETNRTTRTPYENGTEGAYDLEQVDLSSTDYTPASATAGQPAPVCRGFIITGATGTIKIDTPGGQARTLPSGLAVGVEHAIKFTKIYKVGTAATGLVALT